MSSSRPRAGILVTGTEVLTGIISDRNGPWLSQQLAALGVDVVVIEVVGDRPGELLHALERMAADELALVVTSGGLGPTADDLTAEVVGRFAGREMVLDVQLEQRIAEILKPLMARWHGVDPEAVRASNRKQAVIPQGATVLEPVGTAPGLVVEPAAADGTGERARSGRADTAAAGAGDAAGPTVVVLPGPPRELQEMWPAAVETDAFRRAIAGAPEYRQRIVRLFGIPESEIAATLRAAPQAGVALDGLEITTCLRRGEIEIATRFDPAIAERYEALIEFIGQRHAGNLFSRDGSTIDQQVAELLRGMMIAVAESCTGGLMAARLTELPGSSAYFAGGIVAYSNEAKTALVGVEPVLIERHGAVSGEVAAALASGARERFSASVGVGITGIAGPGGGSEEKPVGLVCFSVAGPGQGYLTRSAKLPGDRADVRDRSTTVALHLVARALRGERD